VKVSGGCIQYAVRQTPETDALTEELSKCGNSLTKRIPAWAKAAPPQHLQAFIKGFLAGDGMVGRVTTAWTSSPGLAGDLQEIALKAGMVANVTSRDRRGHVSVHNGVNIVTSAVEYTVTFVNSSKHTPALKVQGYADRYPGWKKKQYVGKVYCLEVETHVVYVRRNGKAFWCSQTYPDLKSSTIQSWLEWAPAGYWGEIRYDIPIIFYYRTGDIEADIWFVSMDKPEHVRKALGTQFTAAWANEVKFIPLKLIMDIAGRTGRYPPASEGGAGYDVIIMDTNPPDELHWIPLIEARLLAASGKAIAKASTPEAFAEDAMLELDENSDAIESMDLDPSDWCILHQAGGLAPEAENLEYINQNSESMKLPAEQRRKTGRVWYERKARNSTAAWKKVYVDGEYGTDVTGRPVFPDFEASKVVAGVTVPWHVSAVPLEYNKFLPLQLGWDYGGTPACVILQVNAKAQVLVLREVISTKINARGMSPRLFSRYVKNMVLGNLYPDHRRIVSVGDPAGAAPGGSDEHSWEDYLREEGIPTESAPEFRIAPRLDAVEHYLTNGSPGIVIDPRCTVLITGFKNGYQMRKVRKAGTDVYEFEPEKNEFSHVQDALQYIVMKIRQGVPASGDYRRRMRQGSTKRYEYIGP